MKIIGNKSSTTITNDYEDWDIETRRRKGVILLSEPILPRTFSHEVYREIQRTRRL